MVLKLMYWNFLLPNTIFDLNELCAEMFIFVSRKK